MMRLSPVRRRRENRRISCNLALTIISLLAVFLGIQQLIVGYVVQEVLHSQFFPTVDDNDSKDDALKRTGFVSMYSFDGKVQFHQTKISDNDGATKGINSTKTRTKPADEVEQPKPFVDHDRFDRFIVFHALGRGQGEGNEISGLLSAHLLGMEFNRTVCVHSELVSFLSSFRYADEATRLACERISKISDYSNPKPESKIDLSDFGNAPDECKLRDLLAFNAYPIVHMKGNTYPRWPKTVSPKFFDYFYVPSDELLDVIPWNLRDPPKVVVHLRKPDSASDHRKGVDETSLAALGKYFSKNMDDPPYLVTNSVNWYEYFEPNFGWSHPPWIRVWHSVFGGIPSWGKLKASVFVPKEEKAAEEARQGLQLWADWYAMIRAKRVYHTGSGFSSSAVHWNGAEGHVIVGTDANGGLEFAPEPWADSGIPQLRDRTQAQLENCRMSSSSLRFEKQIQLIRAGYGAGRKKPLVVRS